MYSDYLNVVEGVRGRLHNIDASLLGVIDRVFVVCHKYGVFVKWCPKMHNRIIYNVFNLVRSHSFIIFGNKKSIYRQTNKF